MLFLLHVFVNAINGDGELVLHTLDQVVRTVNNLVASTFQSEEHW